MSLGKHILLPILPFRSEQGFACKRRPCTSKMVRLTVMMRNCFLILIKKENVHAESPRFWQILFFIMNRCLGRQQKWKLNVSICLSKLFKSYDICTVNQINSPPHIWNFPGSLRRISEKKCPSNNFFIQVVIPDYQVLFSNT